MEISKNVMHFNPEVAGPITLSSVEMTPRFDKHKTLAYEEDGKHEPIPNEVHRRLKTFCVLNRPTAIAVIGMDKGKSWLRIIYHHMFHRRQMEGMLSLSVHMAEKRIADVSSDGPLDKAVIRTFLDDIPTSEELAFVVLDRNGFHRVGRPELFVEGLYLFCNGKETS